MAPRSPSILLTLAFLFAGHDATFEGEAYASPAPQAGQPDIYPDPDWTVEDPEQHGLSREGLAAMAAVAEGLDTSCMIVIHDGVLVGEWYWDGFERGTDVANVFSVTKSITSTLVGIAAEDGLLNIDDPVANYIPQWTDTRSAQVSIRNIISNDSGRFWSFESDYVTGLLVALNQAEYAVGLTQQFDRGTVWEYNNSAIQVLAPALARATGQDVVGYAQQELFGPIGATAQIGVDPSGGPLTYQGAAASCDDMARFGYLALREGRWKSEQIVPKQWINQATVPSTELNSGYGFMWWLNRKGHVVLPSFPVRNEFDGQLVPAASEQVFTAIGAFGQLVIVDPKDEYVIVRLQNIPDLNAALATSPDPVGVHQLREILTAFEAAKVKKGKKAKGKDKKGDK
jgi:CubicO group peptidase (beta-lactamase class C family)